MSAFPLKVAMLACLLIVGHLVPALHAVTSCCDDLIDTAVFVQSEPAGETITTAGCCGTSSTEYESEGKPCGTPADPEPEPPQFPCDEDCSCTLCRAAAFSPIRVELPAVLIAHTAADERLSIDSSSFRSRDQRFDLLRPPQI